MNRKILIFFFVNIINLSFAETVIVMQLDPPSEISPHAFADEEGNAAGIMVDLLELIAAKQDIRVVYRVLPRKRAEIALYDGEIDAYASSRSYLKQHESFLWTDSITVNRDYLYSPKDSFLEYNRPEDLFGFRIGTRLGYRYRDLDLFFESGEIIRDDALSEYQSLLKLQRGRVDAAVVNEYVYNHLLKRCSDLFETKFYRSGRPVDSAELGIAFNRRWYEFVRFFNYEIDIMKKNGALQEILDKYK